MQDRRRAYRVVVALTLVALTWMTWDLRTASDAASGPEAVVFGAFAPVQQLATAVTRPVRDAARWLADQRALHGRLRRLRTAHAQLRAQRAITADLITENARLRALLRIRARRGLRTVGARALGAVPGDASATLVLAAGADRGVARGAAVIDSAGGLVGRVVDVTARHTRVELVTSATARYAVRVVPDGAPGRLRGTGDGRMVLTLDDPYHVVDDGASVVTRAFVGSAVPDGIPIGVLVPPRTARGTVGVRPLVPVGAVDLVQIVMDTAAGPSSRAPAGTSAP